MRIRKECTIFVVHGPLMGRVEFTMAWAAEAFAKEHKARVMTECFNANGVMVYEDTWEDYRNAE